MLGMKFKTFPLMGTWLFSLAFLGATFWHSVFRDGWGFLIWMLLFLSFLLFFCLVLGIVLSERTKTSVYRFLISFVALVLFIPAVILGNDLRDKIFLFELPYYQKITDSLIDQSSASAKDYLVVVPPDFSSAFVNDKHASVDRSEGGVTVLYFSRDSSAVGHAGYLYRSDDDIAELKKQDPHMGVYRIAPHWFSWGD
jgi:hypothetical protein